MLPRYYACDANPLKVFSQEHALVASAARTAKLPFLPCAGLDIDFPPPAHSPLYMGATLDRTRTCRLHLCRDANLGVDSWVQSLCTFLDNRSVSHVPQYLNHALLDSSSVP